MTEIWDKYQTIIFDLDGTLIDSAKDLTDALNETIATENLGPVPYHIARPFAGVGSYALLECAYDFHKLPLGEDLKQKLRTLFLERYSILMLTNTSPFDGVEECLKRLYAQGKNLIIATNKPEQFTKPIIKHLGWGKYFLALVCSDNVSARKPHPAHLSEALEIADIKDDNPLMVGDTFTDYESALQNGFDIAMIDFEYSDASRFPKATYFIKTYL